MGLDPQERTLAQFFKEAGYSTHMIGKWHLGFSDWKYTPTFQGFDTWFGLSHGEGSHTEFTWGFMGLGPFGDLFNASRPNCGADCIEIIARGGPGAKSHGYSTLSFSDEAVRIIKSHETSKPMFMFVAYTAPHAPCVAPPPGHRGNYSINDTQR